LEPISRRLTESEKRQYATRGYVKNLPVFDSAGVEALQGKFEFTLNGLPGDLDINLVNNWHKANRWFYDLCRTPAILDYVEDLLGPDFFQWGASSFASCRG